MRFRPLGGRGRRPVLGSLSVGANKVVWILGSGFSRPLGGPTLKELFVPGTPETLMARFPSPKYPEVHGAAAQAARRTFLKFQPFAEIRPGTDRGGQVFWGDAEEFLDVLDTGVAAPADSPAAVRVKLIVKMGLGSMGKAGTLGVREVAVAAKRLLVAESCGFLQDAEILTERWEPYRAWAKGLKANHTVVTFNYDCVVESLLESREDVQITLPHETIDLSKVRLFKLHGSVDWRIERTKGITRLERTKDPWFALTCPPEEMVIASPGPRKREVRLIVERLWEEAESLIVAADVIVFLGYRFPPTDSEARTRLLGALQRNVSRGLAAITVLGPNTKSESSARLQGLLHRSLKRPGRLDADVMRSMTLETKMFRVMAEPMYAQDFLSVARPQDVEGMMV